jgi:hypothetical protein
MRQPMKPRSTFWPLLKNELAIFRYGEVGFAIAGFLAFYTAGLIALVFLLLFANDNTRDNFAGLIETNILPITMSAFFLPLTAITFLSTIPALSDLLEADAAPRLPLRHLLGWEFFFTRALDRAALCRARTAAFFIFALAPFFLTLAAASFTPAIHINLNATPPALAAARQERYLNAFPASQPVVVNGRTLPGQFAIPHGAVTYTAWLAWNVALLLLLCRAYGALVASWVKASRWWSATPLIVPFLLVVLLPVNIGILQERDFLFFATHLYALVAALIAFAIVVQLWCEHRFRQMEIL